jgi:hypothetical protein
MGLQPAGQVWLFGGSEQALALLLKMLHATAMFCFSCNTEIELSAGGRVGFRDECENCASDLHVCKNCAFYDPSAYNECREPNAERLLDRDRANRCDYFSTNEERGADGSQALQGAKNDLDSLFKK